MPTWPSPRSEQLGTPDLPAIRFTRGTYFGASWFTHLLRPVRLLAPLYGSDWNAQPSGAECIGLIRTGGRATWQAVANCVNQEAPKYGPRVKRIAGGLGVPSCSDLGEGHVGIEVLD